MKTPLFHAEYAWSGWSMFSKHNYSNDGAVSAKDDVEPTSAPAAAKDGAAT